MLLPGLFSTYRWMFDGGVNTDIVASIAPKPSQKEAERANQSGKKKKSKPRLCPD